MATVRNIFELSPEDFFQLVQTGACCRDFSILLHNGDWKDVSLRETSLSIDPAAMKSSILLCGIVKTDINSIMSFTGPTFISLLGKEIPCEVISWQTNMSHISRHDGREEVVSVDSDIGIYLSYSGYHFRHRSWCDIEEGDSKPTIKEMEKKIEKKKTFFDWIDMD
jgi:hypothetical protein